MKVTYSSVDMNMSRLASDNAMNVVHSRVLSLVV